MKELLSWMIGKQPELLSSRNIVDLAEHKLSIEVSSPGIMMLWDILQQLEAQRILRYRKSVTEKYDTLLEVLEKADETGEMPENWEEILKGKF